MKRLMVVTAAALTLAAGAHDLRTDVLAAKGIAAEVKGKDGAVWRFGRASTAEGERTPLAVRQMWKYFTGVAKGELEGADAGAPWALQGKWNSLVFQDGDKNMDTNSLGVVSVRCCRNQEVCLCPGGGEWAVVGMVAPRAAAYDVEVRCGNAALVKSSVELRFLVNGDVRASRTWRRNGIQTLDFVHEIVVLESGDRLEVAVGEGEETDEGPTADATWVDFTAKESDCAVPPPLRPFKPGEVTVGGEIGRRMDVTVDKMLHHTDVENVFAKHFRNRKEKPDEPGGFAGYGMWLDGLVKAAAHGIGGEETVQAKTRLLKELAAAQTDDGQITMFLKKAGYWDNHENAYMIQAFVRDYLWFGAKDSLETAKRLADSLIARKSWVTLGTETAFNLLYEVTKEPRYLDYLKGACMMEKPFDEYDAALQVNGVQHVYTWLARSIAQMEYADLTGRRGVKDRAFFGAPAQEALRRAHGPYLSVTGSITGTPHWAELWDASQIGLGQWGETCASAYLMRLCGKAAEWKAEASHFDLYERVLHNAFFSAQSEDGRKYRYFTPFNVKAGWWNRDTYCCPNNYKRFVFEVPDSVFRRAGEGLAVCLYTPAELKSGGYAAKMATAYPEDGKVTLDVTMPAGEKTLFLRIPKWCPAAIVKVAGAAEIAPSGWYRLRRDFTKGVKVELEMPMPIRLVKGCRAQEGRVAVMRGPCVYALEKEINKLPAHGIDLWDLDVGKPLTWCAEKHAIEAGVKRRHLVRQERTVLLTRYFREERERTYFDPTGPCEAVEDEIAPGHGN